MTVDPVRVVGRSPAPCPGCGSASTAAQLKMFDMKMGRHDYICYNCRKVFPVVREPYRGGAT